jgi:hypothetical protein
MGGEDGVGLVFSFRREPGMVVNYSRSKAMKKFLSLMVLGLLVFGGSAVWAQDSTGSAVSTPVVSATPVAKHKAKKTKKKAAAIAKVYVCPMDGYTSDKPGSCPKCGMSLVEKN